MKTKKAAIDVPPMQAVLLVLAVVLIVTTSAYFARLYGSLSGGGVEQATIASFRSLTFEMNRLLADGRGCAAVEGGQNLFIGDGYAIVGFGAGDMWPINGCDGNKQPVQKPIRPDCPREKACLCLYKTDESFDDKIPLECKGINAELIVMPEYKPADVPDAIYKNMIGYSQEVLPRHKWIEPVLKNYVPQKYVEKEPSSLIDFFLFGHCTGWDFGGLEASFRTQRLYVEKVTAPTNQNVVFIAYYEKEAMDELYKKCQSSTT